LKINTGNSTIKIPEYTSFEPTKVHGELGTGTGVEPVPNELNQQNGFSTSRFSEQKMGVQGNWFLETKKPKGRDERVFTGQGFQKPKNWQKMGYRTDPLCLEY